MFKFFRKYQGWLLAVGGTLLMVTFLIQPALQMFSPSREKLEIGRVEGKKLTYGDQDTAGAELFVIRSLRYLPVPFAESDHEEALSWLLAVRAAQKAGLDVSNTEVEQLLAFLNLDETNLQAFAQRLNVSRGLIRQAMNHWILVQRYQYLAGGLTVGSPVMRLANEVQSQQLYMSAMQDQLMLQVRGPADPDAAKLRAQAVQKLSQAMAMRATAVTGPRLSKPFVERFVQDAQAQVRVTAVPVPATHYLKQVPAPTPTQLEDLFNQYKSVLPGTSQPYGIGYRYPDRVKIEYLMVPRDRVLSKVRVSEADAMTYYNEHLDEFQNPPTTQPSTQPAVRPYVQARMQVLRTLRERQADERTDRVIKAAQGLLLDTVRQLPEKEGYRQAPADFKPLPLEEVAARVQGDTGVLPTVVQLDSAWLTREDLSKLSVVGDGRVAGSQQAGRGGAGFTAYVLSARELKPALDNPLATMRLQANMPSVPMETPDGSRFIFRLTAAQAEHDPASLKDVEAQVASDAKLIKAYQLMLKDQPRLVELARTRGMTALAGEMGVKDQMSSLFARHAFGQGKLETPEVEGLEMDAKPLKDQNFVDGVFALVDKLAGISDVSALPTGERTLAVAVPRRMSLYVTRIDRIEPVTRELFERTLALRPMLPEDIYQVLLSGGSGDLLAPENLKKATGFVPAHFEKNPSTQDPPSTQPVATR